jgi:hypothetical protein
MRTRIIGGAFLAGANGGAYISLYTSEAPLFVMAGCLVGAFICFAGAMNDYLIFGKF